MRVIRRGQGMLIGLGFGHVFIASMTYRYPPATLEWSPTWATLALLAGLACLVAVPLHRTRVVAIAGGMVVAHGMAKSGAYVTQAVTVIEPSGQAVASYYAAACVYAMFAAVCFVLWCRLLIPWTVGRRGGQ